MRFMYALLFVGYIVLVAALFALAWLEPNSRPFWDTNNPSGFHRFVPPLVVSVMMGMVLWVLWSVGSVLSP